MATILIVDDSPSSRRITGEVLRQAGYDVIATGDGRSGLAAAEAAQPDCIVLDMVMPGMNGQDFLAAARERGLEIPVIMSGTELWPVPREHCSALGAREFLAKSAPADDLIEAVERVLAALDASC
jgi:two-component system, chemotaxis family, chemotaxis protein CheY